jgi:hypothetical protein
MSIKKISLLAAVGLLLGALGSYFYSGHQTSRRLASELPPPKLKLKPWAHPLVGKLDQAMDVQIVAVGGIPDTDDQELRLRAEVRLNHPIDQEVKFQWTLPPDASVVSGELEDAWPNLQVNQIASTEIVLTGVSKESVAKTVTLHVSGLSNGVKFGGYGAFATNSAKHMTAEGSEEKMNEENEQLGLKKASAGDKINKIHQ